MKQMLVGRQKHASVMRWYFPVRYNFAKTPWDAHFASYIGWAANMHTYPNSVSHCRRRCQPHTPLVVARSHPWRNTLHSQVDVVLRGRQTNDEQTFVKFDKALATGGVAGGVATGESISLRTSMLLLLARRLSNGFLIYPLDPLRHAFQYCLSLRVNAQAS